MFSSNSCNCSADADIVRSSDADSCEESNPIEISLKSCAPQPANIGEVAETSSKFSEESHLSVSLGQVSYRSRSLSLYCSKRKSSLFPLLW